MSVAVLQICRRLTLHGLVVIALLLVPTWLVLSEPVWQASRWNALVAGWVAFTYALAVAAGVLASRLLTYPRWLSAAAVGAACLASLYLVLLLLDPGNYSRPTLLLASLLLAGSVVLGSVAPRTPNLRWLRLGLLAAVWLSLSLGITQLRTAVDEEEPTRRITTLATSHHTLSAIHYLPAFPPQEPHRVLGGAIAADPVGNGYFLARARGEVYFFAWDEHGELHLEPLDLRIPINNEEFEADVADTVPVDGFRVADLLVIQNGNTRTLYASHHYWYPDRQCFVVRVSESDIPEVARLTEHHPTDWRTVFESSPCLQIKEARGTPFAGVQIGGKILPLDDGRLLLTVGDHQFDGWYGEPNLVQDMTAHYGKTVMIDVETGEASIFTLGNRNPQGLAADSSGRIWSTEHGPRGGDELNLLEAGRNYGYPFHTYGTDYASKSWPPAEWAHDELDLTLPVHAWVPSIAVSDLVALDDPAFDQWTGDLMAGSLRAQSLWRMRLDGDRVAYVEQIPIGERIRTITASGRGEIVLWTDAESIIRITPLLSVDDRAALFSHYCGGCHHRFEHRIGPSLRGLRDRPIASATGYEYSPALTRLRGRWTSERLDAFIADPATFAPGTKMAGVVVPDPETRKSIIEYLEIGN